MASSDITLPLRHLRELLGRDVQVNVEATPVKEESRRPTPDEQTQTAKTQPGASRKKFHNDPERKFKQAKKRAEKVARKQADRGIMMERAQKYLGVGGYRFLNTVTEPVVLVCVDVEATERKPHVLTEVGIAILDTKLCAAAALPPPPRLSDGKGGGGRDEGLTEWWNFISAHHIRIQEYLHHVNHKYVQGCPDGFNFGESTCCARADLRDEVKKLLGEHTAQGRRHVVLVGHNLKSDVEYLKTEGMSIRDHCQVIGEIDTEALYQHCFGAQSQIGLETILRRMLMPYRRLHNAGNDAVYTLRAMIGMALLGKVSVAKDETGSQGE